MLLSLSFKRALRFTGGVNRPVQIANQYIICVYLESSCFFYSPLKLVERTKLPVLPHKHRPEKKKSTELFEILFEQSKLISPLQAKMQHEGNYVEIFPLN